MDEPLRILFYIDVNLPARALTSLLEQAGHEVVPVQVGFKDPAILVTAEQMGAVIITADAWFLKELYRYPSSHRRRFERGRHSGRW
jgi:predicted nuclease of predicted toxin-antitoxin system